MERPRPRLTGFLYAALCGLVLAGCGSGGGNNNNSGGGAAPPPSDGTAQIQGTVTDPRTDQSPAVAGATVVLVAAGDVEDADSIQPMEDTARAVMAGTNTNGLMATTDANGNYTITGVPDGGYYLVVIPADIDTEHVPGAKRVALQVSGGMLVAGGDGEVGDGNIEISQIQSPSANYVGASTCLTCHPDKQKAKKTLHFMGFRKVDASGTSVANGLQDLNSTTPYPLADNAAKGLDAWFTSPPTEILLGNDTGEHVLLGKDAQGVYFQVGADATEAATHPRFRVHFTYGGETGKWKMRYITIVGNDGLPAGLWGKNNKDPAITGSTQNGFGYFIMGPMQFQEQFTGTADPTTGVGTPGSNGVAGPFVKYHDERWDFTAGGSGQFTADAKAKSWDVNCASCHGGNDITENVVGDWEVKFPLDPNGYILVDGSATKYDINLGCEKCHGPGSEHVAQGGRGRFIVQPDDLTPGRATQVCGTCHIRGDNLTAIGGEVPLVSPSAGMFKIFRPGNSPADYFGTTDGSGIAPFGNESDSLVNGFLQTINYETDTQHSWIDKTLYQEPNPFVTPTAAGDRTQVTGSFNHSLGHQQQFEDVVRTKMYKNDNQMVTCFDCHDPHGSEQEHQLIANPDSNAVCLSCHNASLRPPPPGETTPDESLEGRHPANFQFITQAEADALAATGAVASSIGTEVMRHVATWTGNNLMGTLDYDPDGSAGSAVPGSGRCTFCHMPKTAKSASFVNALLVNGSGNQYLEADIHSHTFDVMTTEAVNSMEAAIGDPANTTPSGMTNACAFCHSAFGIIN
jgi:predicted CXXCH cytochrome family protein